MSESTVVKYLATEIIYGRLEFARVKLSNKFKDYTNIIEYLYNKIQDGTITYNSLISTDSTVKTDLDEFIGNLTAEEPESEI